MIAFLLGLAINPDTPENLSIRLVESKTPPIKSSNFSYYHTLSEKKQLSGRCKLVIYGQYFPKMKWGSLGVFLLFCLCLGGTGCARFHRAGVNTFAPILYKAGDALMEEGRWENFRVGVPANLTLMEGLLKSSPSNEKLLASLVKGHAGYAYGVWETLFRGEVLAGKKGNFYRRQAVESYSKAIGHGMDYLQKKNISEKTLHSHLRKPKGIFNLLKRKLGDDLWDLEAVLFMAQSMAGLINLEKQNVVLIGQLSLTKELFDYVCTLNPSIHFGACDLFYGAYLVGRPRMLGGNPKEGRKIFERAIKQYPQNYLLRVAFIENYIIPKEDLSLYKKQKNVLQKALVEYRKKMVWNPGQTIESSPLRLYQAIALKRFELIKKNEKEIF